jgi:pimeloyl-ACP methyl ester carboxylesterase
MSRRPSLRALRLDAVQTRMQRLLVAATRHDIAAEGLVLPADGMVPNGDAPAIHYLEWPGPVHAPEILMLHGGGLHAHTFDLVGNLLRPYARCIAMDLRGHGDSEWAERGQYSAQAIADDVDAVVDALNLERVVVVGHSLGGIGAMAWAARNRPAAAGLAVLDVAPAVNRTGTGSVHALITANPTFADMDEVDDFLAQRSPSRVAGGDTTAANLRWNDHGRLTFKYDTAQFTEIEVPLGDDLRALASRIRCPTTVLRGERSPILGIDGAIELASLIPGATWAQVPDAGHTIQSSNPAGLAAEILRLLR